jgi:hypothetical protein
MLVPIIEQMEVSDIHALIGMSVILFVKMRLAGVDVVVSGSYDIATNNFSPTAIQQDASDAGTSIKDFCESMEWDTVGTRREIQLAVNNRDY